MNNGIASENSDHGFDLTKNTVKTLDNRSLRSLLNDVSTFYEKADQKVQMVVGAMSIQMRNLLAEGRKNADSTTFDSSKACARSISESMVNIVETYQSSFSSKSSFATKLNTNMSVSKPTRSLILGEQESNDLNGGRKQLPFLLQRTQKCVHYQLLETLAW